LIEEGSRLKWMFQRLAQPRFLRND